MRRTPRLRSFWLGSSGLRATRLRTTFAGLCACVAASTLSCATAPTGTAPTGSVTPPADGADASKQGLFERLLPREGEPPPLTRVEVPARAFTFEVPGTPAAEPVPGDTSVFVSIDIGAGSPAYCYVYDVDVSPAAQLELLSNRFLPLVAGDAPLEAKLIQESGVDVVEGVPVLHADWFLRFRADGQLTVGYVKVRVARKHERGIACVHSEAGFRQTFARFFAALVGSFEVADGSRPEPYFIDVTRLSIAARSVGAVRTEYTRTEDGATQITRATSLMVPASPTEFQASDTFEIEDVAPDGSMLRAIELEVEGGKRVTLLVLEPDGDDWKVSGTFKEKELEARILAQPGFASSLGQTLRLRRVLADEGVGAVLRLPVWFPSADPTVFLDSETQVVGRNDDGTFAVDQSVGPIRGSAVMLLDGTTRRVEISLGSAVLVGEREYVEGSF